MKPYILIFLSVFLTQLSAQTENKTSSDYNNLKGNSNIYDYQKVDIKPEFPGGIDKFKLFIAQNTKYPAKAREKKKEGKVYISFIIDKEGKVSHIKLFIRANKHLNREALRVANLIPNWTAGKINNRPVKVQYILPFNFKLNKKKVSHTKI